MFSILEMPSPSINRLLPVRLRSWLARLNSDDTTTTMTSSIFTRPPRMQVLLVLVAIVATVSALIIGDQAPKRGVGHGGPLLETRQEAAAAPASDAACVANSAPNTISAKYPNSATGVLNGSLVVVPIPMAEARAAVPAQWGILEGAIKANLPDFPEGMFPLFIQAVQDHDIKMHAFNLSIPDFSRVSLEFPFIDLLGDGHTSFRWAPEMLLSASNPSAVSGSADYGTKAHPATFDPACNGYKADASVPSTYTFSASAADTGATFELSVSDADYAAAAAPPPFDLPVAFFVNATNQPTFANGTACSNMIRLFDQSLFAEGRGREPRRVAGVISAGGMGPGLLSWSADEPRMAFGIQVATPFAENNYIDCRTLKGYGSA